MNYDQWLTTSPEDFYDENENLLFNQTHDLLTDLIKFMYLEPDKVLVYDLLEDLASLYDIKGLPPFNAATSHLFHKTLAASKRQS